MDLWAPDKVCQGPNKSNRTHSFFPDVPALTGGPLLSPSKVRWCATLLCPGRRLDGSYIPFLSMFPCALCLDFTSHPCARHPLRVSVFFSGSPSWVSPGCFPFLLRILCHPAVIDVILCQNCQICWCQMVSEKVANYRSCPISLTDNLAHTVPLYILCSLLTPHLTLHGPGSCLV